MEKAEVEKLLEKLNKYVTRGVIRSGDLDSLEMHVLCYRLQNSGYKFTVVKGKLQIV